MADIYQEIWNADQEAAGVEPVLDTAAAVPPTGHVRVNSRLSDRDPALRVLTEVAIPPQKARTYDLCRKLFDNYALAEPMPEFETPEERQEVHDLVEAMIDTPPMEVARAYVARETGTAVTRDRWYTTIVEMWFRRFSDKGDPALSGFEHVVVGEQEGSKVQGYHFWYKYWLDDGLARMDVAPASAFPGLRDDQIEYLESRQAPRQAAFPHSVTISYRWHAPDYDAQALRPLAKKIGGFFVGCSVEGLLALGTVRAHKGIRAPQIAVIEGARYDMKLVYPLSGGNQVRTFYPVFLGAADPVEGGGRPGTTPGTSGGPVLGGGTVVTAPVPEPVGPVRIVAALLNPEGDDVGHETVTLVNTGRLPVDLANWRLEDRNGARHVFEAMPLAPGEFRTIRLSGRDVQLSNKGGTIQLHDPAGAVRHKVSYSKAQADLQGHTVLF